MRRCTVELTTLADGSCTAYSEVIQPGGLLEQIRYVKNDFDNGVDITVTIDETGEAVWSQSDVNASATVAPRQATHTVLGVAATLDGTVAALDKIAIANCRFKVVVAQGGNVKSGTLHFLVG